MVGQREQQKKDDSAGSKEVAGNGTTEHGEALESAAVGKRGRGRPPGSKGTKKRETTDQGNLKKIWGKMREGKEKLKNEAETKTDEEDEEGLLISLAEDAFKKSDKIPNSPVRREVEGKGDNEGTQLRFEAEIFKSSAEKPIPKSTEEEERDKNPETGPADEGAEKRESSVCPTDNGEQTEKLDSQLEKLIREMEERIKNQIAKEMGSFREEIRQEISPLPCRCEQMGRIIKDLLTEAEQWKMIQYREAVQWKEEKDEIQEKLESWKERALRSEKEIENIVSSYRDTRSQYSGYEEVEGENNGTSPIDQNENNNDDYPNAYYPNMQEGEKQMGTGMKERDRGNRDMQRGGGNQELNGETSNDIVDNADGDFVRVRRKKGRRQKNSTAPTPLTQSEWKCELEERRKRKKNIKVWGVSNRGNKHEVAREVLQLLGTRLGMRPKITEVLLLGGGPVVTIGSMEDKKIIMRRRRELDGLGVRLDDDLTTREKEVDKWIDTEVEEIRRNGRYVKKGFMKMCVDGRWKYWDELLGTMEKDRNDSFRTDNKRRI